MKYFDLVKRREKLKKNKEDLFYRISSRRTFQIAMNILFGGRDAINK